MEQVVGIREWVQWVRGERSDRQHHEKAGFSVEAGFQQGERAPWDCHRWEVFQEDNTRTKTDTEKVCLLRGACRWKTETLSWSNGLWGKQWKMKQKRWFGAGRKEVTINSWSVKDTGNTGVWGRPFRRAGVQDRREPPLSTSEITRTWTTVVALGMNENLDTKYTRKKSWKHLTTSRKWGIQNYSEVPQSYENLEEELIWEMQGWERVKIQQCSETVFGGFKKSKWAWILQWSTIMQTSDFLNG